MPKSVVLALIVSIGLCTFIEIDWRQDLRQRREAVGRERAELQSLAAMDREVRDFQAKKDALQHRIDFVNGVATGRIEPARAAAAVLTATDPKTPQGIALLVDRNTLNVRTKTGTVKVEVKP